MTDSRNNNGVEKTMKRVMVFGGAGAGKSTLARKLGDLTGLPVIHIDQIFWKSGWVERDKVEVDAMIRGRILTDEWIFDGNYSSTFADRLARADTIIFLDMPTWLRLWAVVARTIKSYKKVRPGSAIDCPERFEWAFLKWVIFYEKRGRRKIALRVLSDAPKHINQHHLKSRRQVKQFLSDLQKSIAEEE